MASATGEGPASPSGRLRHDAELDPLTAWPAVGDWVAMDPVAETASAGDHRLIQRVLPRRTAVIRRSPGDRKMPSQVLAANVDTVFVVTSMNADFNIRRLERFMTVAWESGALPVVLLSKSDLASDRDRFLVDTTAAAPGVEVIPVSAITGEGLDGVRAHLDPGRTVVFTGSSGVGKSSIVNALAGAPLLDDRRHPRGRRARPPHHHAAPAAPPRRRPPHRHAGPARARGHGRRRASRRPSRTSSAAMGACRFSDCAHESEPGCGVRAAIAAGTLDPARLEAWRKLEREAERAAMATNVLSRRAERKKWSAIQRGVGVHMRMKYGADR